MQNMNNINDSTDTSDKPSQAVIENVLKQMDRAVAHEAEKIGLKLHVDVMQDYYFHRDNPEHSQLVMSVPEKTNENHDEFSDIKGMNLNELMAQFESCQTQERKIVGPMVLKSLGLSFGLFLPTMAFLGTALQHHFGANLAWLNMIIFLCTFCGIPATLISSVFWQHKKKRSILEPVKVKLDVLRIRIISEAQKAIAENNNNNNNNRNNKNKTTPENQDEGHEAENANVNAKVIDVHHPMKIFDMIRYQFSNTDGPEVSVDNGGMIDDYYETKLNLKHAQNRIIQQTFLIACAFCLTLTALSGGVTILGTHHDKLDLFWGMMKINVMGSIFMWAFLTMGMMGNNSTLHRLKNKLNRQKKAIMQFKQKIFDF
jgi:hypothetical protein